MGGVILYGILTVWYKTAGTSMWCLENIKKRNQKKSPKNFVMFYLPRSKLVHKFLALWNIFVKSK